MEHNVEGRRNIPAYLDFDFLQRTPSHITINEYRKQTIVDEADSGQKNNTETSENTQQNTQSSVYPRSEYKKDLSIVEEEEIVSVVNSTLDSADVRQEEESRTCIECVKPIRVFNGYEIEVGDHIVFSGTIYNHHGIVDSKHGENEFAIIEATNTPTGIVIGITKFFGKKARIGLSRKTFNFEKQNISIVEYKYRRYSKSETVQNARNCLDEELHEGKKYKYNLFENNCEHFATWCVTGEKFSIQIRKIRLTARLFLSDGFIGISNELKRNKKERDSGIICHKCYEINKRLLSVNTKPIESSKDVEVGDVIRYSYWNLWHEAVVLQIKDAKQTRNHMLCQIAHYAFCGVLSYRTIKDEELEIQFDGKTKKLEYSPPEYNIYAPSEVVQRARSRIGEQQFEFFSNDSSHFARWCKLKLVKD